MSRDLHHYAKSLLVPPAHASPLELAAFANDSDAENTWVGHSMGGKAGSCTSSESSRLLTSSSRVEQQ